MLSSIEEHLAQIGKLNLKDISCGAFTLSDTETETDIDTNKLAQNTVSVSLLALVSGSVVNTPLWIPESTIIIVDLLM